MKEVDQRITLAREYPVAGLRRRNCDCDHLDAVARLRWTAYGGGEANVCEPHVRLVQGQEGVDVLQLEAAPR